MQIQQIIGEATEKLIQNMENIVTLVADMVKAADRVFIERVIDMTTALCLQVDTAINQSIPDIERLLFPNINYQNLWTAAILSS